MEIDTEYNFILFSGGNDSLVTTHHIIEQTDLDYEFVVYLDTGIGLEETKNHVKSVCKQFNWPLEIVETPYNYKEIVKEHGFPGPSSHHYMFIWLKQHALSALNRRDEYYGSKIGLYTGVRQDESQRRMGHVKEKKEGDKFVWYAPMFDWTDEEMQEYRDEYSLPENPTYGKVHMSGDCFCGAYANRDTELIDLQAHYPDMYERLMEIEEEVKDELGEEKAISYWGHGGKNEIDLYFECDTVGEGIVCSSCGVPGEDVDKGVFDY